MRSELYIVGVPAAEASIQRNRLAVVFGVVPWFTSGLKRMDAAATIIRAFNLNGWAYVGSDEDEAVIETLADALRDREFTVAVDLAEDELDNYKNAHREAAGIVSPQAELSLVEDLPADKHVPHVVAALLNFTSGNPASAAQFAAVMVRATGERQFWHDVQTELRILFPWIVQVMKDNDIPYDGGIA